jgi:hypothetical protein
MEVDMSPEAIDARLRLASELLNLCLSLGKAKAISPQESEEPKTAKNQTAFPKNHEQTN